MTLHIQKSFDPQKGLWEIVPQGEIDISTAPVLRSCLDEAFNEEKGHIVLDFDQLRYMDSTGLGVIIGAYSRMKEKGYRIVLKNPRKNILKLLQITNLDRILCAEQE
ncbi:MAG: STAS domain-containing protein [Clostridiales bacterium]|nr:STAS domain-containing protein [Clostridiales bacterium]